MYHKPTNDPFHNPTFRDRPLPRRPIRSADRVTVRVIARHQPDATRSLTIRLGIALLLLVALIAAGCQTDESSKSQAGKKAPPSSESKVASKGEPKAKADAPVTPAPSKTKLGNIYNLTTAGNVYLSGQPQAEDFALLKAKGVATVVSLRTEGEQNAFDEPKTVADQGMTFYRVPFRAPDTLNDGVFNRSRRLLWQATKKPGGKPMLLHCGSGNRVGAIWMVHRVLDHGLSEDEALAEAKTVGLKTQGYVDKAKAYIANQKKREQTDRVKR